MPYEEDALTVIAAYCAEHHLDYEQIDNATLAIPVEGAHGHVMCVVGLRDTMLVVNSLYPFSVPSARRMLVAELAARVNHHINVGTLVVDLEDGEASFRSGAPVGSEQAMVSLVDRLMDDHLSATDRWLPSLAAVCFTDSSPRTALDLGIGTYRVDAIIALANEQLGAD